MRRKRHVYLMILLLSFFALQAKASERDFIEKIIRENSEIKDTIQLQKSFYALTETNSRYTDELEIVYNVLKAKLIYKTIDRTNASTYNCFNKALMKADALDDEGLQIWSAINFAYYFYSYNRYSSALPYFLKADFLIQKLKSFDRVPEAKILFKMYGFFLGETGNYKKSITFLKMSADRTDSTSRDYDALLFNIGQYYYKLGDTTSTLKYFDQSKKRSLAKSDSLYFAKVLGEMAVLYRDRKKYDTSIALLKQDIEISNRLEESRNIMYAYLLLGNIYFMTGDLDACQDALNFAESYIKLKPYLKSNEWEVAVLKLKIALAKNDSTEELAARRKLDSLRPYLAAMDGENAIEKVNWDTERINYQRSLDKEKTALQRGFFMRVLLIVLICCLVVILFLLYSTYKRRIKYQRTKYKSKILSHQIEKLQSEKRLNETNKTLENFKEYLNEKNEQIAVLETEIAKIANAGGKLVEENRTSMQQLLQEHLMTKENWLQFKQAFRKDQPEYYNLLMEKFPDLSEGNLRILLLQKLNLKNLEIANLLGITIDAVKKSKQRMRKKYNSELDNLQAD